MAQNRYFVHPIACSFDMYAAHRHSLLQDATAAEDASRAAVHHESSNTMHSRKAQCQAPSDKPETEDTYHSRERSCAGEKMQHQNVYKRHSSSAPPTTTTSTTTASKIIIGWNLYEYVGYMLVLPQRVAIIVTTRTRPRQTRHGLTEGSGVAQFPPSCQLAGKQGGTCIFWPHCFTDCESCTRPISTNTGSMEACEYGLTRGSHAVSRWSRSPVCCGFRGVFWVGRIFSCFFFFEFFSSSNAHGLLQV